MPAYDDKLIDPSFPPSSFDLLIIGAGPTGLYAAFCAGFRELSVGIIDSFPFIGGQLAAYYPEKRIFDIPGIPAIAAADLIDQLLLQARRFDPTFMLGQRVERFVRPPRQEYFTVEISPGSTPLAARAILVTAGVGALSPRPAKLDIPQAWLGVSVHDRVDDPARFAKQRIIIHGGTLPAVRWSLELAGAGAAVTLIHRGAHLHAPAEWMTKLQAAGVKVMLEHELSGVVGEGLLEAVLVSPFTATAREADIRLKAGLQTVQADHLILASGYNSSLAPLKHWGLDLDKSAIRVDATMRASRPGVWAAGDIVTYDGKVKLLATNFAEAATAVNHIKVHLDPNARLFPGHSSEDGRFGTHVP